ncbi:FAD-binding protein [Microbacterium sp. SYP-A9085]|uniref:FAD-binding oxidoreductase n=1 Tax=Microbacterium sp. SYP-A9085 TaxID=2664454 RepID=UPI00129C0A83|nr:FAD-linked oxidase C-terminal domain-containing protein [Microbacterium sp. SYP-A9085]MRH29170.1 FAD-binding protein [Microbacterium sp. SYP-A9085]
MTTVRQDESVPEPDLAALAGSLPAGALVTDPDAMAAYTRDHAQHVTPGVPLAVVRATCTADVQAALRFAAAHRVPVVPRGTGSGLSGGSTAIDSCIVVALDEMRAVRIDRATRTATAQPGAFNAEVKAAAAAQGLWYPPDPSSFEFCSIGGNVATNAGGLCCVKYGVTADYVLGLTVVLADGRAVTLGGPRMKDVAGLPLTKLFVGSEGTLGVVTEVVLRLVPPQQRPVSLVATFAEMAAAITAVREITSRLRPSMLELMDRTTINAVEDLTRMGLDRDAAAMLVIQSDEPGPRSVEDLAVIEQICTAAGASECFASDDPDDSESFVAARRMAVLAVEKKGTLLLEDAGVPLPRLGDLAAGVERISADRDTLIALVAHAGDGNTHPMIVFDATDADAVTRAEAAFDDIMRLTISLGGTITGEHGVGRLKQPWLGDQLGPDVAALGQTIKDALDPLGILNPGVIFAR